jgi:methionyl-tRNA formyltransferase
VSRAVFMGARQAGCTGLLTLLAAGWRVEAVVAYDAAVRQLAEALGLPLADSIRAPQLRDVLAGADLLVSVHGREIVPPDVLALPRCGGINLHPCLYAYKGAGPVERLLADGGTRASVGVHRMVEQVDAGEVLVETFLDVAGLSTPLEVYNALYPVYATALLRALPLAVAP